MLDDVTKGGQSILQVSFLTSIFGDEIMIGSFCQVSSIKPCSFRPPLAILLFIFFSTTFTGTALSDEVSISVWPTTSNAGYQEGWISLQYWDGSTQTLPYTGYFNSASNTGEFLSPGTSNFPPVSLNFSALPIQGSGHCDPWTGVCFDPQSNENLQRKSPAGSDEGLQSGPYVIAACLINAMALRTACELSCGARGVAVNDIGAACGLPHTCRCNPPPEPPPPPAPPQPPVPPPQLPGSCSGDWMGCTPWTWIGPFVIPDQWTIFGQ